MHINTYYFDRDKSVLGVKSAIKSLIVAVKLTRNCSTIHQNNRQTENRLSDFGISLKFFAFL